MQVMRRYHIQDRDDYKKYNKICGIITKLVSVLKRLDAQDTARIELTDQVLSKCATFAFGCAVLWQNAEEKRQVLAYLLSPVKLSHIRCLDRRFKQQETPPVGLSVSGLSYDICLSAP